MNPVIGLFNDFLNASLFPVPVIIDDGDYLNLDRFVIVNWVAEGQDEAVVRTDRSLTCHIEAYTREKNPYAHYSFGKSVLNLLKHKIKAGSHVLDARNVMVNYMVLDGVRKADITFNLEETEV